MITTSLVNLGIEALKALLLDVVTRKGGSLIDRLDVELGSKDLSREVSNYVRNYVARHNSVRILNMREGVNLQDVYTDSELLLSPQDYGSLDSIEELTEKYQAIGDLISLNKDGFERRPALEFIKENPRLVILGGPGSGKSTLLKKMGLDIWKDATPVPNLDQRLPVFIEIRKLPFKNFNIKEAISYEIEICGFKKYSDSITDSLLDDGKLLVILDGLDEIPKAERSRAIDAIQDFADEYNQNNFLVSCRVAAYQHKRLRNFKDVELASFDDCQIQKAIRNWFGTDAGKAIDCWNKLSQDEFKSIKKLASTPLLLILLCIYFQKKGNFPSNRSILYERAIQVLMEDWNASKGIVGQEGELIDTRQKEILLETIAYNAFREKHLFLAESWLARNIEDTLEDMGTSREANSSQILESIEVEHGLLIQQSDRIYSFSHETIQEFLCAQHISEKNSRIGNLVKERMLDDRWREVFIFISGLRQAEDLLVAMNQRTERLLVNSSSLKWFFSWVGEATSGSHLKLQPVTRRLIATHVALCLYLYVSKCSQSEELFSSVLTCVRVCQQLIRDFDDSIPQASLKLVHSFEKMISQLISIRVWVKRNYDLAWENREKRLSLSVLRDKFRGIHGFSRASVGLLRDEKIFRYANAENLILKTQHNLSMVLNALENPPEYVDFCDKLYFDWIEVLRIDSQKLKRIYVGDLKTLYNYLYCLSLIKQCGDNARHISRRRWSEFEARMLFTRYVDAPWC